MSEYKKSKKIIGPKTYLWDYNEKWYSETTKKDDFFSSSVKVYKPQEYVYVNDPSISVYKRYQYVEDTTGTALKIKIQKVLFFWLQKTTNLIFACLV